MKTSELAEEIALLQKEVRALKQAASKSKSKLPSEDEITRIVSALFSQLKDDYQKLSPTTVFVLILLGALLGSMLFRSVRT